MDRELIKRQIKLKYKPQARPMPEAQAKALLAKYGQTYKPKGQSSSSSDS